MIGLSLCTNTASASHTHDVARITPFARATQAKSSTADYTSGGLRYVSVPPDVTGLTCPETGSDDWGRACTPGQPLAACVERGLRYSTFIHGLKLANIELNRKSLSELAIASPEVFDEIVSVVKQSVAKAPTAAK